MAEKINTTIQCYSNIKLHNFSAVIVVTNWKNNKINLTIILRYSIIIYTFM